MLARTNVPEIKQGVMVIKELSADERVKEFARRREERLREELSALGNAERRGRAKGISKGIAEGIAKGIVKGRAEGRAEGRTEGIKDILDMLRKAGIDEEKLREAEEMVSN